MKRKYNDFNTFKKELLKDPEFRKEYERLQPEFALINEVIRARTEKGITQNVLAEKIGTKQSVISRLEAGKANPSIAFLKRLAQALNSHLEIRFIQSK